MIKFDGVVSRVSPVTKNRVQFELEGYPGLFELFIDHSWVLSCGDAVTAYGKKDKTGKICCPAYRNRSKSVAGWEHLNVLDTLASIGVFWLLSGFYGGFALFLYKADATAGHVALLVWLAAAYKWPWRDIRALITRIKLRNVVKY